MSNFSNMERFLQIIDAASENLAENINSETLALICSSIDTETLSGNEAAELYRRINRIERSVKNRRDEQARPYDDKSEPIHRNGKFLEKTLKILSEGLKPKLLELLNSSGSADPKDGIMKYTVNGVTMHKREIPVFSLIDIKSVPEQFLKLNEKALEEFLKETGSVPEGVDVDFEEDIKTICRSR